MQSKTTWRLFRSKRSAIGLAIIAFLGVAAAFYADKRSQEKYETAITNYRNFSRNEAVDTGKRMEDALRQIYQGIRTISQLPSVRKIDRYGKTLDSNAHAAIEQIYKNMVSNVAVSEIYIVPEDLDPEKLDPETGQLQTPILMYDGKDEEADKEKTKIVSVAEAEKADELEIQEYRLLAKQMSFFQKNYATLAAGSNLQVPMISGPEVITCDDDEFDKTHNDADRKGLVLSVPFYNLEGQFKGSISAIVRTNVFHALLSQPDYALIDKEHGYIARAEADKNSPVNPYLEKFEPESFKAFF